MLPTHIIKSGCGYWDYSNYADGSFCRVPKKEELLVAATGETGKTSHGYLAFFITADGRRVATPEHCFECLPHRGEE